MFFLVAIILLAASHQKTQSCENWQVIDQQINFTGGSNFLCFFAIFLRQIELIFQALQSDRVLKVVKIGK